MRLKGKRKLTSIKCMLMVLIATIISIISILVIKPLVSKAAVQVGINISGYGTVYTEGGGGAFETGDGNHYFDSNGGLAKVAVVYPNYFINTPASNFFYSYNSATGTSPGRNLAMSGGGYGVAGDFISGQCLRHAQYNGINNYYTVANVVDIEWDSDKGGYVLKNTSKYGTQEVDYSNPTDYNSKQAAKLTINVLYSVVELFTHKTEFVNEYSYYGENNYKDSFNYNLCLANYYGIIQVDTSVLQSLNTGDIGIGYGNPTDPNAIQSQSRFQASQAKINAYAEKIINYKEVTKVNEDKDVKIEKGIVSSLDNFLFIGDSRYARGDISGYVSSLGRNLRNQSVVGSTAYSWYLVLKNGNGKGKVEGTVTATVDISAPSNGSYPGISVQLGVNDIVVYGLNNAVSNMKSFLTELKRVHPNTPIFVNSVAGVCGGYKGYQSSIDSFNQQISAYCDGQSNLYYIDISTDLMDSDGYLISSYTDDGVHIAGNGIAVFLTNIVQKILKYGSCMGPFKMSFGGASIGSIYVTDGSNTVIPGTIYYWNWNNSRFEKLTDYSSQVYNNSNTYYQLRDSSGKVVDLSEYETIKVTFVQEKLDVYKCRLVFLGSFGYSQQEGVFSYTTPSETEGGYSAYVTYIINGEKKGGLTINKTDYDTGAKLKAGFAIYSTTEKGYVLGTVGSYTYKNTWEQAKKTPYYTDSTTGSLTLEELESGSYEVREIVAPEGYDLTRQSGYDSTKGYVPIGKAVTLTTGGSAKVDAKNRKYGNLKIIKTDADTGAKLRAGFVIYSYADGKYVLGSNGSYTYNNSWESAKAAPYYTDSTTGSVTLIGLKTGNYWVGEVVAPSGYKLSRQKGYDSNGDYVTVGSKQNLTDGATITFTGTNRKYGSLTINKADADTGAKLKAGFVIYSYADEKYVLGSKGSYTYKNTWEQAKANPYYTDEKTGSLTLEELKEGKYWIGEVVAPEGYSLEGQEGYNSQYNYVAIGSKTLADEKTITFDVTNEKLINISGYVWVDMPLGKKNLRNDQYDSEESKLAGIKVYLKDRKETDTTKSVQDTTTKEYQEDGNKKEIKYVFTGVKVSKLSDYYIEFDYSGTTYKEYIPTAFDKGNGTNTSKAQRTGDFPLKDEDLKTDKQAGKATTYKGTPNNTEIKEDTCGLSYFYTTSLYKKSSNTIEGINLGIRELFNPGYRIDQDIAYVKINYDGYTYKYVYGGEERKELEDTPLVNYESTTAKATYSRDIYPSELLANQASGGEKLKVHVVYKITIKNTSRYKLSSYKEQSLNIEKLVENIDEKYELDKTEVHEKYDSATKSYFAKWGNEESGKTTYGEKIEEIPAGETTTIFIQFKLKPDALNLILTSNPNEITTKVKAEVDANHKYKRDDYGWFNDSIVKYNQDHITPTEHLYDEAPGMVFKLPGNAQRMISGVVFEDENTDTTGNEIIGNGRKEEKEKTIGEVTVQLYSVKNGKVEKNPDGTDKIAERYLRKGGEPDTSEIKTTEGGTYVFYGVLPGEYIVRFTYGDGTEYNVKKYKSTIVTLDSAKSALGNGTNTHGGEWYKYLKGNTNTPIGDKEEDRNYSVAIDNLTTRAKINEGERGENGEEIKRISANTPISNITIENTPGTQANAITVEKTNIMKDIYYEEEKPTTVVSEIKYKINQNGTTKSLFNGFNFGIIEAPILTVEIEKVISNVKLVNAQNNVIFEGNPQTAKDMTGVSSLGTISGSHGSVYTRIELNMEKVYGSTMEIEYTIIITNKSKLNYVETKEEKYGYYYLYGEKNLNDYSRTVQVKVNDIIDYLDPSVLHIGNSDNLTVDTLTKSVSTWRNSQGKEYYISDKVEKMQRETNLKYETLLAILNTENIERGKSIDFTITTSRVLSTEDDDMVMLNDVEVVKMSKAINFKSGDNSDAQKNAKESLKLVRQPVLPNSAKATVTVIPPTGEDRETRKLYIIAGIVVLTTLATGIIIIKKKML